MAVPMTISAAVADFGGRRYELFWFYLTGTLKTLDSGVLVLATRLTALQKEQTSVVNQYSLSRVRILSAVSLTPVKR
jgi:hypothetical protein